MKNYKALNGHAFIKLKERMNDRTESGLYKDITFDVHAKMMIYADVISVSEVGSNEVMLNINVGVPKPVDDNGHAVGQEYVRNSDVKHDVRVGDRIYFHYLTLEDPHNFITFDGEYQIFKVGIHDIFLSARPDMYGDYIDKGVKKKIFPHNQYVVGTEYWGEGWEEVEIEDPLTKKITKIAGKTNDFGMVTETKDKPLENYAIVTDIGFGIRPYSRLREVKAGDAVVLTPNCEFKNEIENQERWVFTHQDILAVFEKGVIRPVADMVLIKLNEREYKGNLEVDVENLPLNAHGKIVSTGGNVDKDLLKKGVEVHFSSAGSRVIDDKYALVHDCNILGFTAYSI